MNIPVITIDGPTASGKGTVAERVAASLGFSYLDSGALYRLVALAATRQQVDDNDPNALARLAAQIEIRFIHGKVLLAGEDVTGAIRAEPIGNLASKIAGFGPLRQALLERQRKFRKPPGLVTDGRDMGTVVFPDATLKIFLTASAEERAERRSKQLIEKGFSVNIATLLQDLRERDARDAGRQNAPLVAAADALTIDSSGLGIEAVVDQIVSRFQQKMP
jgi:cytidylate kinase